MVTAPRSLASNKQEWSCNEFRVAFPHIEREFYFTTDKSPAKSTRAWVSIEWDFGNNRANFNLRIPDRSIKLDGATEYGQTQSSFRLISSGRH